MSITSLLKLLALSSALTLTACGGGGEDDPGDGDGNGGGTTITDTDGDGVADEDDAFPNDSSETTDSDGDGTGDNADVFPNDGSETMDTDGDGTGDNADVFPNDGSETMDTDGDGTGDNADVFPNDGSETMDTDGDGTGDNADVFDNDPAEQFDNDGDGVGDNADCDDNDNTKSEDLDGNGVCDVDEVEAVVLSFNLSGAVSVVTTDNTATQTETPGGTGTDGRVSKMANDRKLNTFVFHENKTGKKLSKKDKYNNMVAAGISPDVAAKDSENPASNFFVIDENGDLQFATESDYDMKISYSVVWDEVTFTEEPDPIVTDATIVTEVRTPYLFFAIDSENFGESREFVTASGGCAIFKVNVETAEWSCVETGYAAASIDDSYRKTLSDAKRKPLQIDENGNVFFLAKQFDIQDDNGDGVADWVSEGENWWNKQTLRKVVNGETEGQDLTPDSFFVESFMAMPNDTVTYTAYDQLGNGQKTLRMVKDVSSESPETIELEDNLPWGDFFYAKDDANTVIYSDSNGWGNGIQFTQPRVGKSGRYQLELDTAIFSDNDWNVSPKRIILADDGAMYGLFVEERWTGETSIFTGKLKRMLPYSPATFASFRIGNDWNDYWTFFDNGQRDVQVAKGFTYYIEEETHPFNGTRSVIKATRLVDGSQTSILDDDSPDWDKKYEIYNWKLTGNEIYFTGFDKNTSTSVTGKIDTLAMKQGMAESEYLIISETASVLGASNKIDDLEVLRGSASDTFTGGYPKVVKYFTDQENLYSASVEFNKYMDTESVSTNTTVSYTVEEGEGENAVEMTYSLEDDANDDGIQDGVVVEVWLNRTMHMIFDTDVTTIDPNTGSLNITTQPLTPATDYTITIDGDAEDLEGFALLDGESQLIWDWSTRPLSGWYVGVSGAVDGVTDGQVGKFAVDLENNIDRTETSLASVGYPLNHKVEYSVPSSASFKTELFMRDSHQIEWNNVSSSPSDGTNNWEWDDGFEVLSDKTKVVQWGYIEDSDWQDSWNQTKEVRYAKDIVTFDTDVTVDADSDGTVDNDEDGLTIDESSSTTYVRIPYHHVDLDGNVYSDRWDNDESRTVRKNLGMDPLNPDVDGVEYYEEEGHYIDVDTGTQYFYNFGDYRDEDLNTPDWETQTIEWVNWGWVNSETMEREEIQFDWRQDLWVDEADGSEAPDLWDTRWQYGYYFSDVNGDGTIDLTGLCTLVETYDSSNCGSSSGVEAGEQWDFNGLGWDWDPIFDLDDFVSSNDEWRWFMHADQGGWGWSTDEMRIRALDSDNPDWFSHDWEGETHIQGDWSQREWMRYEWLFVTDTMDTADTSDDVTTLTLNVYNSEGDVVLTRTKDLFLDVKEASWKFWNDEDGFDNEGFTFDLLLQGGDAIIDNIRVTDLGAVSEENTGVIMEETFDTSGNVFTSQSAGSNASAAALRSKVKRM